MADTGEFTEGSTFTRLETDTVWKAFNLELPNAGTINLEVRLDDDVWVPYAALAWNTAPQFSLADYITAADVILHRIRDDGLELGEVVSAVSSPSSLLGIYLFNYEPGDQTAEEGVDMLASMGLTTDTIEAVSIACDLADMSYRTKLGRAGIGYRFEDVPSRHVYEYVLASLAPDRMDAAEELGCLVTDLLNEAYI